MNNDIKQYLTKGGKKRFRFTIYLGKDALTGRSATIRRKGFKSLQEAQETYLEYQLNLMKRNTFASKMHLTYGKNHIKQR